MTSAHVRLSCAYGLWQISGENVGDVKVVDDMHQRKAEMARQSEAFIALPGARCYHHRPR